MLDTDISSEGSEFDPGTRLAESLVKSDPEGEISLSYMDSSWWMVFLTPFQAFYV